VTHLLLLLLIQFSVQPRDTHYEGNGADFGEPAVIFASYEGEIVARQPVVSKAMVSVGYAGTNLDIEFPSGAVYRYYKVPYRVFEGLMRAPSKGRYFNANIRGHYKAWRVNL